MAEFVKTDPQIVNVGHIVTEEDGIAVPDVSVMLSGNYVDVDSPFTETQDQYSSSLGVVGDLRHVVTEEEDCISVMLSGNYVDVDSPFTETQGQYSSSLGVVGDLRHVVTEEEDGISRVSVAAPDVSDLLSGNYFDVDSQFTETQGQYSSSLGVVGDLRHVVTEEEDGINRVSVAVPDLSVYHVDSPFTDTQDQYSSSIYTGDLSLDVTEEDDLINKFSSANSVELSRSSITGKSLGCAYVNSVSPVKASNAMACLNHADLNGNTMPTKWSDERHLSCLFIQNLDSSITSSCLERMFSPFGTILSCEVAEEDGHSKCFGYVQFDAQQSAVAACRALHGSMVHGKKLFVERIIKTDQIAAVSAENQEYPQNLYVDNLMGDVTEDFLHGVFSWYGRVSSVVIMRDGMGRSEGFGFVSFCHPDSAMKAIKSLNGLQIGSNKLFVGWALTKSERMEMLKQPYKEFNTKEFNLSVNNLSESVEETRLKEIFGRYGQVVSARVMRYDDGKTKGFGFVGLSSLDESELAKRELNGSLVDGKSIVVGVAECEEDRFNRMKKYCAVQPLHYTQATPIPSLLHAAVSSIEDMQCSHVPASACYIEDILMQHHSRNPWVGILDPNGMPSAHYRFAPIVVYWDVENCMVPAGCDPYTISDRISRFLRQLGYEGYIRIIAVAANIDRVPLFVRQGLHWSGIRFHHLHTHRKQASDIDIKRRIRQWMRYVRGPRNLLLISGDGGFASTLMDVEIHSHNTMVAYNEHSVSGLISYVGYSQFAWRELLQY